MRELRDCAADLTAIEGANDKDARNRKGHAPTTPSLVADLLDSLTKLRKREASNRACRAARRAERDSRSIRSGRENLLARVCLSPPARNVEQRASDIGRRVADQPDGRLGDFLSRAWAPHWGGRAQNARAVGSPPLTWMSVSISPGRMALT